MPCAYLYFTADIRKQEESFVILWKDVVELKMRFHYF